MASDTSPMTFLIFLFFLTFLIVIGYLFWNNSNWARSWFGCGLGVGAVSFNATGSSPAPYSVDLTPTPSNITRQSTTINLNDCSLITDTVASEPVIRLGILRQAIYVINLDVSFELASSAGTPVVTLTPDIFINGTEITVPAPSIPFAEVTAPVGQTQSLHVTYQMNLPVGSTVSIVMSSSPEATIAIQSWSMNLTQLEVR